jgi:hypothetical protein
LTRFAGTKVHIVHQTGIEGPNTASRLVAETLSKVGMTVSTSALNRVPLHAPVDEAMLVARIWSEQVDVAGNAGVIRFAVRLGHGPEREESVRDLRMTTMSILFSVYRCLASTQQGA